MSIELCSQFVAYIRGFEIPYLIIFIFRDHAVAYIFLLHNLHAVKFNLTDKKHQGLTVGKIGKYKIKFRTI